MTLSDLIAKLQKLEAEHGGDVECLVYNLGNEERPASVEYLPARWRQACDQPALVLRAASAPA